MSEGVSDKKEKIQRRVTLQNTARSTSRWCTMLGAAECYLPNWAASCSHEQADLLYCHWCIIEQRRCKELWVIGFCFFSDGSQKTASFISASRRLRDRANWNLYIHWLCSHPSKFCYSKTLSVLLFINHLLKCQCFLFAKYRSTDRSSPLPFYLFKILSGCII